ncbi:MAG: tetratricopeptide repeat protein [Bacteroidales bacterium]|nr:tetratricopeptide repeat protein [Bacteroidales bacterium]
MLTTNTDTSEINLLNKIAVEYSRTDLEKMREYSTLADSISSTSGYAYGKAEGLRILGVYYMRKSDYSTALQLLRNALTIFEKAKSLDGKANCLLGIGATYNQTGNNDSALIYFQKSLDFWLKAGAANKERIAATYNNIGLIYRKTGNMPLALEYYQKSLLLKEEIGDKAGAGDTYNNMGVIYRFINAHDKAIEHYKNSIKLRKEIGYEIGVAMGYNNIAIAYSEIHEFDSAVFYAQKALDINLRLNNIRGLAHNYNLLGDVYLKNNELNLALEYFIKGKKYAEESGNKQVITSCDIGIGEVSFKHHDLKQAYLYGNLAFIKAKEMSDKSLTWQSSKLLADACAAMGKYKEAYEFQLIYKAMSDSIQNDASTKKIIGLEYDYKYQKDKIEQEKIRLEQQARLTRQKHIAVSFIIAFCLLLFLAFYIFSSLKHKQRDFRIISDQKLEIENRNKLLNSQKEEIQTQNELLQQQAKMLAELSDMKSHFFANISHELRTPLTLIISPLLQAIETHNCDKATLDVMLRNAKKLQEMIDELLQMARLEKGAVEMHPECADLNALVKDVVNSFEGIILEKGIILETEGIENEYMYSFDRAGIEKVVTNLLSNAIKFTPRGRRVKLTAFLGNNDYMLCVSDEGIGIPEGETGNIFDRFYRASNSRNVSGTGIGLSLVSDIVTLHGGTIKAGNSAMGGAEFIVKLPLNRIMVDKINETSEDPAEFHITNTGKKPKSDTTPAYTLLIVEDNHDLQNFLASSLTGTYNIVLADNGKAGLQIALEQHVDIVVSDVMMPEMDGYALTKAIRNHHEICHLPIVLLTAKSSEESLITGLENEANAYITKPFSLTYLKAVLTNQLKIRDKLRTRFQKELLVIPSDITTTSLDEQFISNAIKIVEDNIHNELFSVDDFCNALLMGRTSVHRRITAITGLSSSDFIRTLRLKRAVQLLKGKVATISEISTMVGFSDVSYFTKCFKKQFGSTPTDYQSKN